MLIKVGDTVINTACINYIDLFYRSEYTGIDKPGVMICFEDKEKYFWDEEAEVIRWYFTHPTSDVVDIENLKG